MQMAYTWLESHNCKVLGKLLCPWILNDNQWTWPDVTSTDFGKYGTYPEQDHTKQCFGFPASNTFRGQQTPLLYETELGLVPNTPFIWHNMVKR